VKQQLDTQLNGRVDTQASRTVAEGMTAKTPGVAESAFTPIDCEVMFLANGEDRENTRRKLSPRCRLD
jgi:hypothetical protein